MSHPVITLLTDFGTRDYFVGCMKGVILNIHPPVRLVDISHEVEPQNILEAAFLLKSSYRYFPKGTIHVVVVDPGVGSHRRMLVAESKDFTYVAPDNGVLSWVYEDNAPLEVTEITETRYNLKQKGRTFEGRDRFAPIAAWIAKGVDPKDLGKKVSDYLRVSIPKPLFEGDQKVLGQVLYVDRFGNLMTNIGESHLQPLAAKNGEFEIIVKDYHIQGLSQYYAEGKLDKPHGLINSDGYLELFSYRGNAAQLLGAKAGTPVEVFSSNRTLP